MLSVAFLLHLLTLSGVSFLQVFMLGFQSRCVNTGNYLLAFLCSSVIGFSQMYVWKQVTASTSLIEATVYSLSGATAIMAAIWTHKRLNRGKT